jgi:hypothetical protein
MVRSPRPDPPAGLPAELDEALSLPDPLWDALEDVCRREGVRLPDLLAGIRRSFEGQSLAEAVETFVAVYYRRIVHAQERNRTASRH